MSTNTERKQRFAIIGLSVIVLGLTAALLTKPRSGMKDFFKTPEADTVVDGPIKIFNNETDIAKLKAYKGVYFDASELEGYLSQTLPDIKKRYANHMNNGSDDLPSGYELKIGFYWKLGPDAGNKQGLGFYVVPLVTKNGVIEDYFLQDSTGQLNKSYPHSTLGQQATYNVYNEGHLFP
ncbi:MAG: hypothetical protein EOP49_38385 [Sphingobacteriales bacterium]|nr:MAG: hypothetical protein EOP49_38385 [Sphingobacteriales bacterium]